MSPVTGTVADTLTLPFDAAARPEGNSTAPSRESPDVDRWLFLARTGDQAAFGRLIELHQRVVFRTALAALGQREDAEDVAQEAFLLAWRKLPGFRGESTFRTWVVTIAWRRALDRRRSRLRWWKRAAVPQDDTDPFADIPGTDPGPEHTALARDAARRTRREIIRLSPTLRDTLLLAASGEYTYQEIATLLGAPLGTIKWRVAEARRLVSLRLDQ